MADIKQERSYGAVVFNHKGQILIENMALGHVSLPKGHIEKGETPYMCTLREIKEETGLQVEVDMGFSSDISYSPYPDINKTVTFFLAIFKGEEKPVPQLKEVSSICWEDFSTAYKMLTYDNDREVLKAAYEYYKAHY